jgi:hypothetical protein
MWWKKWATLSCNYPTGHLCGLWFGCNNLLTTSFEHTYHPWRIREYFNTHIFVLLCCSFLWHHLYYKLVCTWGLKLGSKQVQGKRWAWNRSQFGTITPNGNTRHFIFKHVKRIFEYILLSTCLCYLFPFICVFCFQWIYSRHMVKINRNSTYTSYTKF